jgi:hypothetical protein
MEQRDLEDIERFFVGLGHKTPLAYYGLPEDASSEDIEPALKKRRTWAQGQQANPKYRAEALFLIKSNNLLRRLLLEERDVYVDHFGEGNPRLTELNDFIRHTLERSGWNPATEAAIRIVGKRVEFDDPMVDTRIQAIARELNVKREGDADLGDLGAIDAYALLDAEPTASAEALEAAYRARYRWARSLKDHEKAGQVLGALDAAWRILQDPQRRATYDAHRIGMGEATEEVERGARELDQLLIGAEQTDRQRSSEALIQAVRQSPRTSGGVAVPPPFSMPAPVGPPPGPAGGGGPVHAGVPPGAPVVQPFILPEGGGAADLAVPPPVAAEIQGRTIGLATGPQMVRERAPRLKVPVKLPVMVELPRSGATNWSLRVVNEGQGRMPGKVVSDVPWLVPARDWLDPSAKAQDILIDVRGELLPAGSVATGNVTVVTDHGQRVQLPVEVRRASNTAALLALLALVAVGAAGWYGVGAWQAAHAPPPPVVLRLAIDPPADVVAVDSQPVGKGANAEISPPSAGRPFRLRVERDGFRAHEELISLGETMLSRTIRLELTDPMTWRGGSGEPAAIPQGPLERLARAAPEIATCSGAQGQVQVRLAADEKGVVRGMELEGEGIDLAKARPCVGRVARTLVLDPPEGASWSRGEVRLTLPGAK